MYRIFERSYESVTREIFARDLGRKSHVIMLHDPSGALRGFSTLVRWRIDAPGHPINFLFSGDTVVDPEVWGSRALAIKWLEVCGAFFAKDPQTPLYWLLTTKGPRTYRFLPLFFDRFYPRDVDDDTSVEFANEVGRSFFLGRFDAQRGVVVAGPDTGHLSPKLAEVPNKDRERADVSFFMARNPGFGAGDELLCLARVKPSNIRVGVRRFFQRGIKLTAMLE